MREGDLRRQTHGQIPARQDEQLRDVAQARANKCRGRAIHGSQIHDPDAPDRVLVPPSSSAATRPQPLQPVRLGGLVAEVRAHLHRQGVRVVPAVGAHL